MSEIVHIENLEKTYVSTGETLTVLKALDLSVEEGSKVVITGESGCGKSTLLNIIGGIDSATSGIVRSGGRDITALDENAQADYRSHFLGFVFQFHYLLKDFTALENVYLPAYMAGVSKTPAPSAFRAFGRRTPTGCGRARSYQRSASHPRGRTDGKPRSRER